jgi:hypothetical protein
MSQDHSTSHSNSVCSYPDPSSMEATCPPTTRNFDYVYANMPHVITTTLMDEDVHLKEMLIAQLDLIQQQATMDKKQIREELFGLKNRIKWREDRALEQQVGSTELAGETSSTPSSSQRHQRVVLQPLRQDPNNIMIPSLHPVLSQQNIWETWNRSRHEQLHQTIPSENDDSEHDPHAVDETQSRNEGARWGQLNRVYNEFHDNGNNAETTTPIISDDEDDIAAILDLPLAKSEGEDIMDNASKMATAMTKIDMPEDLIVMHEKVTTFNMQGLHTGEKEEDIFAKEELPANKSTHQYDGKHETYQVARYDDMHMDVDNKYVTTVKLDETIETNLKEEKNVTGFLLTTLSPNCISK